MCILFVIIEGQYLAARGDGGGPLGAGRAGRE
jgi:hypothetical protein